jgi:hypothetical protein
MTFRMALTILGVVVSIVASSPAAFGQAAIAGVVSDSSGAPMTGVLVEVTSPALIEQARTALSDETGQYRVENLPPGLYKVRFTSRGWRPYLLEGVELTGSFTANVDTRLEIGALTDVISVAGQIPAVDVHSARREVTLNGDVVRAIPTARSYNALLVLVPGVLINTNDTVTGTATTSFPIYGGRTNEGRLLLDGLTVGSPPSGNSATTYVIDVGNAEEITFTTAGGLGETETGGLAMNIVPKSGGNTMRGSFFASGTGSKLQSDNLTDDLRAQGLPAATPLSDVYDVSGTFGGPLRKDRAWYFLNAHTGGSRRNMANIHYNLNVGNPGSWRYSPDLTRPEYSDRTFENASSRLTWQMTPRHKIVGFFDAQAVCRTCSGATPGGQEPQRVTPEAVGVMSRSLFVTQGTWLSPITDRLLLEAGFSGMYFGVGNFERQPNPTRDLIRVAEQCANGCADNGNIQGLVYRSQDFSDAHAGSYLWKGSVSYVTGTHNLKIGYQHALMTDDRTWFTNNQNLTYRVNNGVPNQLTQSISPWVNDSRVGWEALFVQEQWTRDRLTIQGAIRFDRARSWFPAQQEGPSRFLPSPIRIPETRGVDSYKDITPRVGLAYDVFGTGRTALKMRLGRYLEGAGTTGNYANTNPTLRMPQTTQANGTAGVTRAWNDANGNFVPDCDLFNPASQDLRASGGDMCGVMSNTNFGKYVLTNNFDPAVLDGWAIRPSDWNFGISFQQQIHSRASLDVSYIRRSYAGFFAVDNLALSPSDLTPFSMLAPVDPRLPGGGGYMVTDLYDVVPQKAGQVQNLVARSSRFGEWYQYFNGVDLTVNLRSAGGLTLVGGTSTGRTVADNCNVRAHLPELSTAATGTSPFGAGLVTSAVTPLSPYCHVDLGLLTQFRGLSSYMVPTIDVQVSAIFQSKPGAMLAANYVASNAEIAPQLGRDLSGNALNVTVNLVPPGTMYGDRINQLDLRFAKTLRYGRSRTMVAIDVFNALNSSAVLAYNNAFVPGGQWLQPMSILTPRFFKFSAEVSF